MEKAKRAKRGVGNYELVPGYQKFFVSPLDWNRKTDKQRDITINDFKRLGIRTRKEGLYQYLREVKTTVDIIQHNQTKLTGFTFYIVDEDKEICAKFLTAKELYLIILDLRLKPNIHWEDK